MTLDEKIAQITCVLVWKNSKVKLFDSTGNLNMKLADSLLKFGLGHIRIDQSLNLKPRYSAVAANNLQKYLKEKTRLGIPVILHEEALHGHVSVDGTSFSMPMGIASTWDTELAEKLFSMTAEEIRSRGSHYVLAPVIDLGREPRWGRTEETFGEDPYLVSQMGLAAVNGFQGHALQTSASSEQTSANSKRVRDSSEQRSGYIDSKHVISTLKHFCHGEPEGGKNTAPFSCSERVLRENFFYPFKVCIIKGKAESVMASYNEIDGVPSHANKWLLQKVLRDEWGFKGAVVSDYWAISMLAKRHHIAKDYAEAAKLAINAGVDIEFVEPQCYPELKKLVENKTVNEKTLDKAVAHILRHKFMLGLFENTYADPDNAEKLVGCEANRKLALQCAHESVILLKNEKNIAPLNPDNLKNIAVIGPNANRVLLGGYSYKPKQFVTVLDGIKTRLGNKVNVIYSEGCRINEVRNGEDFIVPLEENKSRINEAVIAAKKSDVVVLAIGANEELSSEGVDRANIDLIGSQNELVKAIVQTGKPVIGLLFNGSPLTINYIKENVPVIYECWYMGQETGTAIADILFGEINPSGKLPITIPRSVGQLPDYYNCKPTSTGGYIFEDNSPLYPFGYGMSYTTFEYSNFKIEKAVIYKNESTKVYADIKNTGKRAGDEIVQLYIRELVTDVTRPLLELKGFKRVHLEPGETRKICFEINPDLLSMWDGNMNYVVEPGEFSIMIGASSTDIRLKSIFKVLAKQ